MGSKQTKFDEHEQQNRPNPHTSSSSSSNIYLNTNSLQRQHQHQGAIVKRKISHSSVSSSSSSANSKWRHSTANSNAVANNISSIKLPPPLITQMAHSPRANHKQTGAYEHYREAMAASAAGQLRHTRPVIAKPMSNRTNKPLDNRHNYELQQQQQQQQKSKFGLSPRVKRKIVDVISKTTNAATNQLVKGGHGKHSATSKSGKLIVCICFVFVICFCCVFQILLTKKKY